MSIARFTPSLFVIAILQLSMGGCGGRTDDTISVRGQVTYRGEPLTEGAVTFFPTSGRPTMAPLSEDGSYRVDLKPGDYTVTVNVASPLPPGFKEGDVVPPPKFVLPPEYTTRARSTLKATVRETDQQPINFELK